MEDNMVQEICSSIIKPISDKIDSLDTKIGTLLMSMESRFKSELEKRDHKIVDLTAKFENIYNEREADKKELKLIKDKLSTLEAKNIDGAQAKFSGWSNSFGNDENIFSDPVETEVETDWRPDDIESQDLSNIDLLVAGDSCVKHLDLELMNPGKTNRLICVPGGKAVDIRNRVKEICATNNVSHCVVHVGTNHTSSDEPIATAEKLVALLREIKTNMPQTSVYFSSILPKYDNEWLSSLNLINRRVYESSKKVNFSFIGHYDFATHGFINHRLLSRDGIHPSYSGVAQMARDIKFQCNRFK